MDLVTLCFYLFCKIAFSSKIETVSFHYLTKGIANFRSRDQSTIFCDFLG